MYGFFYGDFAWISISEPGQQDTIVSNVILDGLPNLKISFWDITKTSKFTNLKYGIQDEVLYPPSYSDARRIVNFILKNECRDLIINCAAGYSRSTAVCKFCEDVLGYKWVEGDKDKHWGKSWSDPNPILYQKMVDYYHFPILTYFSDGELVNLTEPGVIINDNRNHEEGDI